MKQLLFYKWSLLALVLLNLAIMAFLFLRPQPPKPNHAGGKGGSMHQQVIDILRLDADQEKEFIQLANQHNSEIMAIKREQQATVALYLTTILEDKEPSDSLTRQLQQLELHKVDATYQHFKAVKAILKEDQKAGFKRFIDKVMPVITGDQKRNGSPPKNF